jgi:hypothetical protein
MLLVVDRPLNMPLMKRTRGGIEQIILLRVAEIGTEDHFDTLRTQSTLQ